MCFSDQQRAYVQTFGRLALPGLIRVRTAGPARLVQLEPVLANDGHLAELSRQARERALEPSRD